MSKLLTVCFFEVNLTDGQINYQDAINAYLNIETQMQNMLDAYDYEVKFYTIANVEYEDGNFKTLVYIRYKNASNKSTKYFYSISGDWHWRNGLGRCDGTGTPRDLMSEIGKWIRYNRAVPANVFYTHIGGGWDWFGCYEDDNDGSYYNISSYGVSMFWEQGEHVPIGQPLYYCIGQSDCNYYAQQTNIALNVLEEYFLSSNRDITSFTIDDHFTTFGEEPNLIGEIGHKICFYHGIRRTKPLDM